MKLGLCKDTCAPGVNYFIAGREYFVDETDRFIRRHFIFKDEAELMGNDVGTVANPVAEPMVKKSRKKKSE